jgi:hypothetical protein
MNYFQIWIGNKPSQNIQNCMLSVLNKLTSADTYTLIASRTWSFLDAYPVILIKYEDFIDSMFKDDPKIKEFWDFLPEDIKFHWIRADVIRYYFLSKNKNFLYLDTDITLKQVPILQDHVYFSIYRQELLDCNILYNGNDTNFFNNFFQGVLRFYLQDIKSNQFKKRNLNKSWAFIYFNKKQIRDKVFRIDRSCYEHGIN